MPQQKIVIKVQMECDRCRSKALALVAAACGVDSVALAGDGGVDSISLTSALRKKVGPAEIVQVARANSKEIDIVEQPPAVAPLVPDFFAPSPWYYYPPAPAPAPAAVAYDYDYEHPAAGYAYGRYQAPPDSTCSIM